jgi:cytochrome c oxidase assembly factor CtaG
MVSLVSTFLIIAALLLVGTPTSYALNQRVLRPPMSKNTAWLLSLSTWGFASLAILMANVFSNDFWAVFIAWVVVYFGSRRICFARYKKSHQWPTTEARSHHS